MKGAKEYNMRKNNKFKNCEMIRTMYEKQTGITLIALMITIIVLLILAGVTLSLTLGERGIFKTANDAKIKTERAEIIEKAKLAIVDVQTR